VNSFGRDFRLKTTFAKRRCEILEVLNMATTAVENLFENDYKQAATDPRIAYPCYKSLDDFIDLPRLRALDSYITEKINRHIETKREDYFLNLYRLSAESPYQPGVREIWLSSTKPGYSLDYLDLVDEIEAWSRPRRRRNSPN
jgi:hypothetical protein